MPEIVELAKENWLHYIYARDHGHLDYVNKATLCENYFYGQHWDPQTRSRLTAQGKPVLTINKVFSSMIAIMGEQLQNRAGVKFLPVDDEADPLTAEVIDKLYMHILNSNDMGQLEACLFDDGAITSRGFIDVRMNFENNLRGEVEYSPLNAKNIIIDPDADQYDPDTWNEVFLTKWMTPNDIALKYNAPDAKELELKSRSSFEYGIDSIDSLRNSFSGRYRQKPGVTSGLPDQKLRRYIRVVERQFKELVRKEHFVDMGTGDMRVIPDSWDRNRIAEIAAKYELGVFPKEVHVIRWRVSADNFILHDEVSPYKHFTPVPYFPVFHKGYTIGMVENIISPQDYLNKTTSQELHVVNTTANSGWQMEEDQLVNMDNDELETRGAETGLVLVRKKGSMPLEKIQPNQVPQGLDRIAYKADEFVKELSGVSDSSRGFDRADVAAKAIQAKQAVGGITNAKMFSNLAYTRKLIARNTLDLVQEFYTEERVIRITGKPTETGTPSDETIAVNQTAPDGGVLNDLTIGKYDVTIVDTPARNKQEDSQFDEATAMREMGIPIPDHVIVESSHLNNKKEIAEEIKQQQGGGDATETEQRMAELETQLKELEVREKQVAIMQKAADAEYTRARAQKTAGEARSDNGQAEAAALQLEARKAAGELQVKREEVMAQIALQREKMQAELALKREIARADNLIKRAAANEKTAADRQAAIDKKAADSGNTEK